MVAVSLPWTHASSVEPRQSSMTGLSVVTNLQQLSLVYQTLTVIRPLKTPILCLTWLYLFFTSELAADAALAVHDHVSTITEQPIRPLCESSTPTFPPSSPPKSSLFTPFVSPASSSTRTNDPFPPQPLQPCSPMPLNFLTDGNPPHQAIIALYTNITTTETGDETAPQPATPVDEFDQYGILAAQLALVMSDRGFLNALLGKKVSVHPPTSDLAWGAALKRGYLRYVSTGSCHGPAILQCDAEGQGEGIGGVADWSCECESMIIHFPFPFCLFSSVLSLGFSGDFFGRAEAGDGG